jgi:hypothetical protein
MRSTRRSDRIPPASARVTEHADADAAHAARLS